MAGFDPHRLPLQKILHVECKVDPAVGKKVITHGRIFDPASGTTFCESNGTFILQPIESFGTLTKATDELTRIEREKTESQTKPAPEDLIRSVRGG